MKIDAIISEAELQTLVMEHIQKTIPGAQLGEIKVVQGRSSGKGMTEATGPRVEVSVYVDEEPPVVVASEPKATVEVEPEVTDSVETVQSPSDVYFD